MTRLRNNQEPRNEKALNMGLLLAFTPFLAFVVLISRVLRQRTRGLHDSASRG